MPSVQVVEHEVCSFGIFSILTMQTRQEPSMPMPGVIAVVRDGDAAFDGGLQDGLALLDGDRRPSIVSVTVSIATRSYPEVAQSVLILARSRPASPSSLLTSTPCAGVPAERATRRSTSGAR